MPVQRDHGVRRRAPVLAGNSANARWKRARGGALLATKRRYVGKSESWLAPNMVAAGTARIQAVHSRWLRLHGHAAGRNATHVVVERFYKNYDPRSNMPGATKATSDVWRTRLKEARVALGLSQKQLGVAAGLDEFVASTRINRYEVGVHAADYPMAVRLAQVLQVPVAYLYCDGDEMAEMLLEFHRAPKSARRQAMAALQQRAAKDPEAGKTSP